MKNKKTQLSLAIGLALYQLLITGLVAAERMSPHANITGYLEAYWYTFFVIVTRGYGDLYPVTIYGRIIGYFFVVTSIVLYLAIIGAIVSTIITRKRRGSLGT
jgi:voltage-gated potassium channel